MAEASQTSRKQLSDAEIKKWLRRLEDREKRLGIREEFALWSHRTEAKAQAKGRRYGKGSLK